MVDTTGTFVLVGSFVLFLFFRLPVTFALGAASILAALYVDIPLTTMAQQMVKGVDPFVLIAIPFFILAGELMGAGGISSRLVRFSEALVGRFRGGFSQVNILSSMFFGGISGSSVADTSSIGSIMIPMMEKAGYEKDYSVSVTVASSTQGLVIPPSHNIILYSVAAGGLSVGRLFLAGVVPGILLGVTMMILAYFIAAQRGYPRGEAMPVRAMLFAFFDSMLGLMTAVIIVVGVVNGMVTVTESAAVAALWAFFVTFVVYREIPFRHITGILRRSVRTLAIVMGLMACAQSFGYMLTIMNVPSSLTEFMLAITDNKYILLLTVNVMLLALGMIMDMSPIIIICTPILLPVVKAVGMSEIQFGVVLMLNLGIGLITPPVGATLFVGCSIGRIPMEKVARALMPFYLAMVVYLVLITFVPAITLWLPDAMMAPGGAVIR